MSAQKLWNPFRYFRKTCFKYKYNQMLCKVKNHNFTYIYKIMPLCSALFEIVSDPYIFYNYKSHFHKTWYKFIEDLTRVVISYKITTSVRFCLSYDPLKRDFIAFKVTIISIRKRITCSCQSVITLVAIRCLWHDVIHWKTAMSSDNYR